jgi:L-asparagine oxygenase
MHSENWSKVRSDLNIYGHLILREIEESQILGIARSLGQPVPDTRTRELVRPLLPVSATSAPSNTLSSRYGTGAFPFHTETVYWPHPVRYLMLYCVRPGAVRRPTFLSDLWHSSEDDVQHCLAEDIWVVYRTTNPFLTRIADKSWDGIRIRFDPECMKPAHRSSRSSLILQYITPDIQLRWQQRDLLIVDNHRMLHARGDSPAEDEDRLLLRVLVKEEKKDSTQVGQRAVFSKGDPVHSDWSRT